MLNPKAKCHQCVTVITDPPSWLVFCPIAPHLLPIPAQLISSHPDCNLNFGSVPQEKGSTMALRAVGAENLAAGEAQ